jgi:hypothetical protein
MRLDILNTGYSQGTKLLFSVIRLMSGRPLPDAAKLVFYRPDFYGNRAKAFTPAAMRGPSAWSVADRELMAAHVIEGEPVRFLHRRAHRDREPGLPGRATGHGGAGRPGDGPDRGAAPGHAAHARPADRRKKAWAQVAARHGKLPGVRVADKMLEGGPASGSMRRSPRHTRARSWPRRTSKVSATIHCWGSAITPAGSRWRGCCARARPGATRPRITSRSLMRRSARCRRRSAGT